VDNKGSWIQGTHCTLLEKRYQAYDKTIDLIKDDKKVFIHTDQAGDNLLAVTNALNTQIGDKKVVSFCSQKGCSLTLSDGYKLYGMSGLHEICEKPEETIDYLFSKGFQVVMVSPCIQKGWRYNSTRYNFDATVGVYIYDFITAPTIVQRTQRCVGVTNHYLYIQSASSYIDTSAYESILQDELNNSIYGGMDTLRENHLRHNKEICNEATLINGRHKTNVKLHFTYVWSWFGGRVAYIEAKGESAYKEIKRLIASSKKELRLAEARDYRDNEDKLKGLIDRFQVFTEQKGLELTDPTLDEIVDLLKIISKYEYAQLDCEKALRVLFTDEVTAREWDMFGASYLDTKNWNEEAKKERSLLNNDGSGHVKIWMLLHLINTEIWNTCDKDLRDVIAWDKRIPLAIHVDDIRSTEYAKVFKNFQQFYLDSLSTLGAYKDPTSYFKNLLELVFQCKIKHPKAKDLVSITNALICHYIEKGIIKGSVKNPKPHKNQRVCADKIRNKIMRGVELHAVEQDFLNYSGKILLVYLPELLPNRYYDLYELLQLRWERDKNKSENLEKPIEVI
jgi:hypothetical protein